MENDTTLDQPYEAPCIEARDPIGLPLIGGPAPSNLSAAFRPRAFENLEEHSMSDSTPTVSGEYEPPTIDDRSPIALPLIGTPNSNPPSAAFRPELAEPYVAPRIVDRTRRRWPTRRLRVGTTATMRRTTMEHTPIAPKAYEPPTIEARAPISVPLIGVTSGVKSAAFRPL